MAKNSKIQWCDHTFNPWIGCTKVSAGCANCYAATQDKFRHWTPEGFGKGKPRHRTSEAYWRQLLKWNKLASRQLICPRCGIISMPLPDGSWEGAENCVECEIQNIPFRPKVFCASLADWLDPEVPIEWFVDLLRLWFICQNLDILALTKRPENWNARIGEARKYFSDKLYRLKNASEEDGDFLCWLCSWHIGESAPKNVWVGATVENQDNEKRIADLLNIPARVRFLSCEPLLGGLQLYRVWQKDEQGKNDILSCLEGTKKLNWVICGGESGPHARPMHPDWARSLRDQCKHAGVPFFFKQWGEWVDMRHRTIGYDIIVPTRAEHGKMFFRVGKKAAGFLLDGVEHRAWPEGGRG